MEIAPNKPNFGSETGYRLRNFFTKNYLLLITFGTKLPCDNIMKKPSLENERRKLLLSSELISIILVIAEQCFCKMAQSCRKKMELPYRTILAWLQSDCNRVIFHENIPERDDKNLFRFEYVC